MKTAFWLLPFLFGAVWTAAGDSSAQAPTRRTLLAPQGQGRAFGPPPRPLTQSEKSQRVVLMMQRAGMTQFRSVQSMQSKVKLTVQNGHIPNVADMRFTSGVGEVSFRGNSAGFGPTKSTASLKPLWISFTPPAGGFYLVDITFRTFASPPITFDMMDYAGSTAGGIHLTYALHETEGHVTVLINAKTTKTRLLTVSADKPWYFHSCEISAFN